MSNQAGVERCPLFSWPVEIKAMFMNFRSPLMATFVLLGYCAGATAQESKNTWNTNCEGDSCTLSLTVVEVASNRNVATFLAVVSKNADAINFGVALPLGTALTSGVRLVVNDITISIPFRVCFPDGCRALTELSKEESDTLLATDMVDMRFFPYSSGKPVSIKTPLENLTEAIEEARKTVSGG
jgi:invasion protein IalB